MAQKISAPNKNVAADQFSASNTSNIIIPVILSLYLLVDCVPAIEIQDQMGLHWLLIALLNLVAGLYIFSSKEFIQSITIKPLFKNSVVLLYLAYFIISGLSLFVTINSVEGLVIYARLTTVCMALISFCLLLRQRVQLLGYLGSLIMFIVLAQSFFAVMQFYSGAGKVDLGTLVNSLQSTTGNKNIFAAALVIKTPFIIYCIFSKQGFIKYIAVLSLCLALMSISLINARAAYLGIILELLIVVSGTAYLYFKQKQQKQYYVQITYVLLAAIFAFFITQNTFSKLSKTDTGYGMVGKRLATITDIGDGSTSIRLGYSPNTIYDQYLKCNIYQEAGKPDSAYKYAKIAFYAKPRHFYYYRMASYLAGYHKDGQEVINMFNKYNTYRHDQQSRSYFAQSLLLSGYDTKALKKVVEEGLKQYPTDSVMLNIKAGLPK